MQTADNSAKEGRRDAARQQYREAAAAYPTDVAPWSKLATDYFDTNDNGNAILAAQEVLAREPQNLVALSVLAVSGLRVSTAALTTLRKQQTGVPSSTQDQAEALTKTLREALGETILVPQPAAAPPAPPPPPKRTVRRPARPAAPSAKVESTPAPAARGGSLNPFDKLK